MAKKFPPFGFNIQRILDCGFQIEEMINPNVDDTLIKYAMGFHFNVEENYVQFNVRADFVKGQTEIFATGTVLTKFGILNLKAFADENGGVTWPKDSLETMFGIAFSHMRAIVAKNFAGTRFSSYVVPLVNPALIFEQLIKQDPNLDGNEPAPNDKVSKQELRYKINETGRIIDTEKDNQ